MALPRRSVLIGALLLGGAPIAFGQARIEVGPPLGVVTLRIGPANEAGFLHDLADYTNRYGFFVYGRPGGPKLDGRDAFLAWYRRDDGIVMLISDVAGPERMEAYFYGRRDGTGGDTAQDLMIAYGRKMGSYPAFTPR